MLRIFFSFLVLAFARLRFVAGVSLVHLCTRLLVVYVTATTKGVTGKKLFLYVLCLIAPHRLVCLGKESMNLMFASCLIGCPHEENRERMISEGTQ